MICTCVSRSHVFQKFAMAKKSYDYIFKLLLIGDSDVGKTSILFRFSEDAFNVTYVSTIGIDFKIRTIELDGKRTKLQIWDTAGQERFQTITSSYYRGAMGILLVYDIANARSFKSLKAWIKNIEEHASDDAVIMLVGNKVDVNAGRQVPKENGEELAMKRGFKFMEICAKTGENVDEAFFTLARDIKKIKEEKLNARVSTDSDGQRLDQTNEPVKSTSTCNC